MIPSHPASSARLAGVQPRVPRRYGPVNWLGLWTLTARETRRFLKVYTQTIAAPVITTLLFLAVYMGIFSPQFTRTIEPSVAALVRDVRSAAAPAQNAACALQV